MEFKATAGRAAAGDQGEQALKRNRVVITGIGVLAANGIGKDEFWRTLIAGQSGIGPITLFDASDLDCQIAGEIKAFNPEKIFPKHYKTRRMGRFTQLGLFAADEAIKDAKLTPKELGVKGFPVVTGVSTTAMDLRERPSTPYSAVTGIPNAAGSAIAYCNGIEAELCTVSNGCASSLDAVGYAFGIIQSGRADVALAGGCDGPISRYVFECLCKSRKVSCRNDAPRDASRPFDRQRDGGVAAEGAGFVVLESLDHALARGVLPYCEVSGYASHADPAALKEGAGLKLSMQQALANAGRLPGDVNYISMHGPSDLEMDVVETEQVKKVLGDHAYRIPVSSIKGATGNPMGTGGVLQVISTALAFRHEMVPPTANLNVCDEGCDLDYVPGIGRAYKINFALVNSHGFGRGNSSVVLKKTGE